MMTTAKGLTSGYVPMGAVFVAPRVAEPFFDPRPVSVAARLHLRRARGRRGRGDGQPRHHRAGGPARRATRVEETLHNKLAGLADHPAVAEVRSGIGAVAAVQLADPATALGLVATLRDHGVSGRAAGVGAMQFSPAFVMTDEQIAEMAAATRAALG